MKFRDRTEAGKALGRALGRLSGRDDVVVLGMPRGGVTVALEVARALDAPLDIFVVRKLGVPGHDEYAMGAIASGGVRILNEDAVRGLAIPDAVIERVAERERRELERRERLYRGARAPLDVEGRVAILVDDGLATGASMRAAIGALRKLHPARIVVAVPVGSAATCAKLRREADEVVCPLVPLSFQAVGVWYDDFAQTTDAEVRAALEAAHA